jgi:cyclophilin family peptidyl-prolyl cis-trans isomerase
MSDQTKAIRARCIFVAVVMISLLASPPLMSRGDDGENNRSSAPVPSYDDALIEWRQTLKSLFRLKAAHAVSSLVERPELIDRWLAANDAHFRALENIHLAGAAAYTAATTRPAKLEQFLLQLMHHDIQNGRYQWAYQLGNHLRDAGCKAPGLEYSFGVAAFASNHYPEAKTALEQSVGSGQTPQTGAKYLAVVDQYIRFWQEELAIREKEAMAGDLPRVVLHTTDGDIVLELFENEAPETVGNFISLVETGFYDGQTFFRVTRGFVAQTGSPTGTGEDGPGYSIYCECFKPNYRKHFGGSVAMAKFSAKNGPPTPDSAGSQFFINFQPSPHLNGQFTVFGRVIEGMGVVTRLQPQSDEDEKKNEELIRPDRVISAKVLRKRDHEYVPHKVE